MKFNFLITLLLAVFLTSCGEYNKVLKSTDTDLKYTYAKKYFEEKKYGRTCVLLEELQPILKGTSRAQEGLYLLAQSYFYDKDYVTANAYYNAYTTTYPKGEYTEICRYQSAYSLYLTSPDSRLDQTYTVKAMQQFGTFMEIYPNNEKIDTVRTFMFNMQEKLAEKELMACQLYYNLGNYMGNNFESCVVTAREALKNYPFSKYAEDYQLLIVKSRHELAIQSVSEKQSRRFRDVIDEYFNYLNMFPQGKYIKEVDKYYKTANKYVESEIQGEDKKIELPTSRNK